jgi:hypothetical protein
VNNSNSSSAGFSKGFCLSIKVLAILFGAFAALESFGGIPGFIQKAKEGEFDFTELGAYIGIGLTIVGIIIALRWTRRGAALMIAGGLLSGLSFFLYELTREARFPRLIFSIRFVLLGLPFIFFGLALLFCDRHARNRTSPRRDIL